MHPSRKTGDRQTVEPPDYGGALAYARHCLESELSPLLVYHNVAHTFDDVLPAAMRLARLSGLDTAQTQLLAVAAAFHDIGYTRQIVDHEEAGVKIAVEQLPGFGFGPRHLQAINGMIMATRLPQSPHTLAEQILADADLDLLGRADFWKRNDALREEMANLGQPLSMLEWYQFQFNFVESHSYFTPAARMLRDQIKRQHLAALKECLQRMATLGGD